MIHDPELTHRFVMLFEIKNGSTQSLDSVEDPMTLTQDVRYGLVKDGFLRNRLNRHLQEEFGLPMLLKNQVVFAEFGPKTQKALCKHYFNVRMFGITNPLGQSVIAGPVSFSWAKSLDPILPLSSGQNAAYGLYRLHGSYNPSYGQETGVGEIDLDFLWQGLYHLLQPNPELTPMVSKIRGLWIFSHKPNQIPSKNLFSLVKTPPLRTQAQKFEDYQIQFPTPGVLEGQKDISLTYLA